MSVSDDDILQLGIEAARDGNREEARQLFSLLTRQEPDHETAWLWLAGLTPESGERAYAIVRAFERSPDNEIAERAFRNLELKSPEQARVALARAALDLDLGGLHERVRALLATATARAPSLVLLSSPDLSEEALRIELLTLALADAPRDQSIRDVLGSIPAQTLGQYGIELFKTGKQHQAHALFRYLAEGNPRDVVLLLWVARSADNPTEERALLARVLEIEPGNATAQEALNRLSQRLAREDERALAWLRQQERVSVTDIADAIGPPRGQTERILRLAEQLELNWASPLRNELDDPFAALDFLSDDVPTGAPDLNLSVYRSTFLALTNLAMRAEDIEALGLKCPPALLKIWSDPALRELAQAAKTPPQPYRGSERAWRQTYEVTLHELSAALGKPRADLSRLEAISRALEAIGIATFHEGNKIDWDTLLPLLKANQKPAAVAVGASTGERQVLEPLGLTMEKLVELKLVPEPEIKPFSLDELGLTPEELAALGLEPDTPAEDVAAAEGELTPFSLDNLDLEEQGDTTGEAQPAAAEEPEFPPFSLEDLGLTPEEIASLDLDADGDAASAGDAPADLPELTPFSLDDLGLDLPQEAPAQPAAEEEPELRPFSLADLGLSEEEIAALTSEEETPSPREAEPAPPGAAATPLLPAELPPAFAALPSATAVEVAYRVFVAEQRQPPPDVLDVLVVPAPHSPLDEAPEQDYQVVLGFREPGLGHESYVEGQLGPRDGASGQQPGTPAYGAQLAALLFAEQTPEPSQRLLDGAEGAGLRLAPRTAFARALSREGLRVQLRISNRAAELHAYPWEYLWPQERELPLACDPALSLARLLHVGQDATAAPPRISPAAPLRILAALSSPSDLGRRQDALAALLPIDRAELEALQRGLREMDLATLADLDDEAILASPNQEVSLSAIVDALDRARGRGHPFQALHLICHGVDRNGRRSLVLRHPTRDRALEVSGQEVAERLKPFRDTLRLIVLAACGSALPSDSDALGSVARQLVAAGFPAVVAMQGAIEFRAAQHFAQKLYGHLALRGEIDRAVNAARYDLFSRRMLRSRDHDKLPANQWGLPVLFSSLSDGRLFEVEPGASQQDPAQLSTRAISYAEAGGDTRRLALSIAEGLGLQLGLSVELPDLAKGIATALASALPPLVIPASHTQLNLPPPLWAEPPAREPSPPPLAEPSFAPPAAVAAQRTQARLFDGPDEHTRREALQRLVEAHRRHEARRIVLAFRRRARLRLRELVADDKQAEHLSDELLGQLRDCLWRGGVVSAGQQQTSDILGGGPPTDFLRDQNGERMVFERVEASFFGNLIWPDEGEPPTVPPAAEAIQHLLSSGSPFETFDELTAHPESGLDPRSAALLLYAAYPDRFLPYGESLALAVLDRLDLTNYPRYNQGYKGFHALAHDLLADEELGFDNRHAEGLADVFYFFQRLAADHLGPPKGRAVAGDLRLRSRSIHTDLVVGADAVAQVTTALIAGKHVILSGPPGTGKTTLAEDICKHAYDKGYSKGYLLITATADWTTFDTIGGYVPEAGDKLAFQPGIVLDAIATNKWLIIDEINRADIDKAFGELFTVLSGQAVTLPYRANGRPVRILPPRARATPGDYVIDPHWRIIGTMNVYDKASLFAMSYAFMRRFAFVEVGIPQGQDYRQILEDELRGQRKLLGSNVFEKLCELFSRDEPSNHLMRHRAMGPAIARDVARYVRVRADGGPPAMGHLVEALRLYIAPQLDGLDHERARDIVAQFQKLFGEDAEPLLRHIEELFPFASLRRA